MIDADEFFYIQLSGLSRFEFETLLSENEIPISNLTINDVLGDTQKLK
jgi:hypothetical protein